MEKSRHQEVAPNKDLPIASVSCDERSGEQQLRFASPDGLERAWQLGIFYLKTPDHLDLESARQFGRQLIRADSPYRRIPQYGELEGFIALENNQQTKLALSRPRWEQHYPAEITQFGRRLDDIGIAIMRAVLRQSGIPEERWDRASGGYSSGRGTAFLNFVHYDTSNPDWGLHPHADYGFVTILDVTTPGLQIEIDGEFEDVPVRPGYLVINFGEALRYSMEYSGRAVTAVRHRVVSQRAMTPVRHGIVYFANPDLDGVLWQFDVSGEDKGRSSVRDLFALLEKNLVQNNLVQNKK